MLLTSWAHARDEGKFYAPESCTWYHAFRLLLYYTLLLSVVHAGTFRTFDYDTSFNFFVHDYVNFIIVGQWNTVIVSVCF